ncbi:hypothetical protein PAHAL_2G408100 [Panicum hallii]|jgi:hypothetical protein|uniref:Uncharacterized protein n=1 Tax=Panicum hallii TaxID=206008 RepID=A0A2T8KSA5_9POAL|nr:hypothetical protein PAHAL_2G408100 [Panicum hallii]
MRICASNIENLGKHIYRQKARKFELTEGTKRNEQARKGRRGCTLERTGLRLDEPTENTLSNLGHHMKAFYRCLLHIFIPADGTTITST